MYKKMKENICRLRFFKEKIIKMLNEPDQILLKKIKFIYYCLLFPSKESVDILSTYSKCLTEPYSQTEINSNDIYLDDCYKVDKECIENRYIKFALENMDYKFENSVNNPFYYNSKYYSFPTLLKKNIIQNNKEIHEAFLKYLKYIYSSNLLKDIFYLSPEFNDFIYPLDDDEIFNEAMEYTIFMPFDGDELHGYTQKEVPEILISVNLEEKAPQESDISKIMCELSEIVNTCIHEQLKHYLKALIFYNSFRFNIKKRINSDLYNYGEEDKYIKGILFKMHLQNKYSEIDGGHKAEIYLYGKILDRIYFSQALELFRKSNWDKEIIEHIENFNYAIKNKKDYLILSFQQILSNDDLCDFFKTFVINFIKLVSKEKYIVFDNNASAKRKQGQINDNQTKNNIKFESSCYINIKKNYIYDSSL